MPRALENEALHYWTHVQRFRLTSGLTVDKSETADELAVLAQYSEHPVIRKDVIRVLRSGSAVAK